MRKKKPARRTGAKRGSAAAAKSARKNAPKNIDEYLVRVPEPARTTLTKLRAAIRSVVPRDAVETISYRIPAFQYKQILVWFAAFSGHCSFFPTAAVIEAHKPELKSFTLSKGTIQFPIDKPFPASLVKKLVNTRLAHIESKRRL